MICSACEHENRTQARFCEQCGEGLDEARLCAGCGEGLRAGARFCDACGAPVAAEGRSAAPPGRADAGQYTPKHLAEKILNHRSALEGERKQVTVFFADVKGSMELAEQLDAEEWHRVLERFFEILSEGVHRFEGCVNQYTGDGIMALFGAPIACEDHAQRACYAALWLRDRLRDYADELRLRGLNFSVRTGLNSGEVVVGRIGDDLRMDYTAQGHTVGLAQRMEQLAAPGHIVLAANTAHLVEPYFQLKSLGPLSIKGMGEPVEIFDLEAPGAVRTRLDASRSSGFSRFVGRTAELEALETALENAGRGHARAVGVVGEAGVGKSRLCDEFVRRCRRLGLPVYEAHCLAHATALPLHAFLELTRSYFGIVEQDGPAEARRKVAGTLVLLQPHFQESLPLIFDFMGVPDPERPAPELHPEQRERAIVEFLRELVGERSRRESALVLVDDLHWIDPDSDALLAELVTAARGTRTLLLFNFRPEYHAAWMEGAGYQALSLAPLSAADVDRMLDELLGGDVDLVRLKARIGERAAGNPFFIEEIVRELVERGDLSGERGARRLAGAAAEIEVPPTVQAVLAARIDRLPDGEKQLIQQAAVMGREFSEALLARVSGLPSEALTEALARLCSLELIRQTAFYPEAEYEFQHPLTSEVAYRTQLKDARARIHGAVANAIEELSGDRVNERAALIAQHLDRAGEALEAARWYLRAGELNRQVSAGMRHWRRALELLRGLPDSPAVGPLHVQACARLLFAGWRVGLDDVEAVSIYEEGREVARRHDDTGQEIALASAYALIQNFHGDFAGQFSTLNEALGLLTPDSDPSLVASIHQRLGWTHMMAGNLREALEHSDRGLEACGEGGRNAGQVGGYSDYGYLRIQRGLTLGYMGRLEEARVELELGLALAEEMSDPVVESNGLAYAGLVACLRGEPDRGVALARRGFEKARDLGEPIWIWGACIYLSYVLLENRSWQAAADACEEADQQVEAAEFDQTVYVIIHHAAAAENLGHEERARELVGLAEARLAARQEPLTPSLELRLLRTRYALEGPATQSDADADLDALVVRSRATEHRPVLAVIAHERASRARARGDHESWQRRLEEARELHRELGAEAWVQQINVEMREEW